MAPSGKGRWPVFSLEAPGWARRQFVLGVMADKVRGPGDARGQCRGILCRALEAEPWGADLWGTGNPEEEKLPEAPFSTLASYRKVFKNAPTSAPLLVILTSSARDGQVF